MDRGDRGRSPLRAYGMTHGWVSMLPLESSLVLQAVFGRLTEHARRWHDRLSKKISRTNCGIGKLLSSSVAVFLVLLPYSSSPWPAWRFLPRGVVVRSRLRLHSLCSRGGQGAAQGRRWGAGRCPPSPVSAGLQLRAGAGRAPGAGSEADGDDPPPSRGGCRWRSWCRLAPGGRGGAGGSQGSGGAVGRAAAVPREKVTGGRAMDRRVPEKAPRRAVVPGGAGRLCVGGTGRRRGGAAPCRSRRRGLPGGVAAGRWERGAAASS